MAPSRAMETIAVAIVITKSIAHNVEAQPTSPSRNLKGELPLKPIQNSKEPKGARTAGAPC
jgi:hypothetical protein